MKGITPKYSKCYFYNADLSQPDKVTVTIEFPSDVKKTDISVQSKPPKGAIVAKIKNEEIPFFAGVCFQKFSEFKWNLQDNIFTMTIVKEDSSITWPILINKAFTSKFIIDPMSAFILSNALSKTNVQLAQNYLQYSVNSMFPPAIVTFVMTMAQMGNPIDGYIPVLFALVDEYQYGKVGPVIGDLGLSNIISLNDAFGYIKKCADLDDPDSQYLLACFLSPKEKPHGTFENGEEAYQLLEKIQQMHPYAKLGLGRLLYEGIGCAQNKQRANQLLGECRKDDPSLPQSYEELEAALAAEESKIAQQAAAKEIAKTPASKAKETATPEKEKETGLLTKLAITGTIGLFIAAAGFTIFKSIKNRH